MRVGCFYGGTRVGSQKNPKRRRLGGARRQGLPARHLQCSGGARLSRVEIAQKAEAVTQARNTFKCSFRHEGFTTGPSLGLEEKFGGFSFFYFLART